jgi:uncharacterized membrane protein
MLIATVVVIAIAILLAVLLYITYFADEEEEDRDVLTVDTSANEGNPTDALSYSVTVYNPGKKADIYSTMVSGLPPDWEVDIPTTVSVNSKESFNQDFTITPSPETAVNKSYEFTLTLTSGNLQRSYSTKYELTVFHATYGVELLSYNNSHDADPGRNVRYTLLVRNTGNGEDEMTLSHNESQVPGNWTLSFEYDSIKIPGLEYKIVICTIETHENTTKGRYDISVTVTASTGSSSSLWLNTSLTKDFGTETVVQGDKIQVDYIGAYPEGEVFDTSIFEVANNSAFPKGSEFSMRSLPQYAPLKMFVGQTDTNPEDQYTNVIEGFWEGVEGLKEGETNVVRFPPEKGYGDTKWRVFEITVVSID